MAAENLSDLSLVDIVEHILKNSNEPISIYELIEQAANLKGVDPANTDQMTQLYMDITLSGKFVFVGEDKWALKDGNLEFWDKDGYAFIQPEEIEEIEDDEIDFSEFVLEDVEDAEEEELEEEEDEEELDEEIIEEKEYVDVGLDLESTDEDDGIEDVDLDLDDDYDEDDYNDIMDEFEDMYDE
ncbi:DNA-directed RNA polymerase subunit delta [Acholeplasma equirhinis]|uniref:DNA-directed RNA polymerase subunit delta n=1 Tax=Acholeplasma equirhinis TaxID=555393 RepID=UPI00197A95B8|nr:DNA-directed RNA polymerase subunit delta [Acholeplasma equirhinis]MBN3491027.1 DNA-directed RNA polymerase subunit delta [Acholeplasma equirhinis]